jgi:hypothetical protein
MIDGDGHDTLVFGVIKWDCMSFTKESDVCRARNVFQMTTC